MASEVEKPPRTAPALSVNSASPVSARRLLLLLAALAVGCGSPQTEGDAGVDSGTDAEPSCAYSLWGPEAGDVYRWPEPEIAVEGADTDTGYRLSFDIERYPDIVPRLGGFAPVLTEDLSDLDGFGLNADAFFTYGLPFDATRLPSGDETAAGDSGLGLVVVEPGPARVIPVFTYTGDDGHTVFLRPMVPLPPRALVAAFMTDALTPATVGGCLAPSPSVLDLVESPDANTSAALAALAEVGALGGSASIVALSVFPTQSLLEDVQAVSEDIEGRDYVFDSPPRCEEEAIFRVCTAAVTVFDYRDDEGVFRRAAGAGVVPTTSYSLPLTIWLPLEPATDAPYPTMLFGHGLNGTRNQGRLLAEFAAPLGVAVVAAPALEHGEHPTANPEASDIERVMDFFAINIAAISTRVVEGLRLRDNFRQSIWDRHQIVRLLEGSPDVDGDGRADLDGNGLGYLGASLGGILGPQLLASTDAIGVGVLALPGGKIISIVGESEDFGALVVGLRPSRASEGDILRFYPIIQTVVDRGDAASYGPYVQHQRISTASAQTPSVLLGMALDDSIVPNISNFALGRAMAVPIIEPLLRPEDGFEVLRGPIAGNIAGGLATGGYLQFDRVQNDRGDIEMATHNNTTDSDVGLDAWFHFLTTHWNDGLAEIRDPYAAVSFPE